MPKRKTSFKPANLFFCRLCRIDVDVGTRGGLGLGLGLGGLERHAVTEATEYSVKAELQVCINLSQSRSQLSV